MVGRDRKTGQLRKRLQLAFFLAAGTFLLAHTINGVVAYSLEHPGHQISATYPALQPEPGSQASRRLGRSLAQDVLSSGLFPLPPAPMVPIVQGTNAAPPPPPLNIPTKVSLLGVVRGPQNDERAIIEELSSKKQGLYRVSQRIPDVGQLAVIESDRVLIREGEQEEWLELAIVKQRAAMTPFSQVAQFLPPATPVRMMSQIPAHRQTVDRSYVIQATAKPTEARFLAHVSGRGQVDGIQIDSLRPYGLLEQAGIKSGDVLSSINGVEIRDTFTLLHVLKQLQQERTVQFNLIRQSKPMSLFVDISG